MNAGATFALLNRALRIESRSWRGHGLRLALGTILLLMVWQQADMSWRGAAGKDLLTIVSWTAVMFFTLFGFSHFTSAITEEKEEGTLGLMRLAGLSPVSILLGKGAARLCDALILAACVLPFAVLAVTLGGVTLNQVLASAVAVSAHAVLLCGLGLLCSTICATLQAAGKLFLVLHLLLFAIPPWLGEGLRHVEGWELLAAGGQQVTEWGIIHRLGTGLSTGWDGSVIGSQAIAGVVGGIISFLLAWLAFDRFAQDGTPAAGTPLRSRLRWRRVLGLPRPPTGLGAIAWKDYHLTCGGRWGTLFRLLGLAVIAGMIAIWWRPDSEHEWRQLGMGAFIYALIWVVIETGAMLARLLAVEVREQTLDGLLMLPVTPAQLIRRKLMALPKALAPALSLGGLGLIIATTLGDDPDRVVRDLTNAFDEVAFWSMVVTVFYFWSLCLWLSLRVRRAPLAMAIGVTVLTWFLLGMLAGLLGLFRSQMTFFTLAMLGQGAASAFMLAALPGMLRRQGAR